MLSREQAQALTHLTHLLRPAWNEEGIYAALGRVKDRDAFEVALATLRAAADTKVKTPGAIPSAGPHWNEAPPKEIERVAPRPPKKHEACADCGRTEGAHNQWSGHDFRPLALAARGRSNAAEIARARLREATAALCTHGLKPELCADHDPRRQPAEQETA